MSVHGFRRRTKPQEPKEAPFEEPLAEETASKKDGAFALFDSGKTPDSPEVEALGLKLESAKRYFRQWKKG